LDTGKCQFFIELVLFFVEDAEKSQVKFEIFTKRDEKWASIGVLLMKTSP
jgi:hypothetical protein